MGCGCSVLHHQVHEFSVQWKAVLWILVCVCWKKQNGLWAFIKIYWVFPRLPLGIVAYTFTHFLDNHCRNSCIQNMIRTFTDPYFVVGFSRLVLYTSTELLPSWHVHGNSECKLGRVSKLRRGQEWVRERWEVSRKLSSLDTLPRLCPLLQTKMAEVWSKLMSLKISQKNRGCKQSKKWSKIIE